MPIVQDQKISQLSSVSLIPATSTTVLEDGSGGNQQAPITGQSVQTNHPPVNYTSAGTQITQHLAGIDNALGSLGGNTVNFRAHIIGSQTILAGTTDLPQVAAVDFNTGGYFNSGTLKFQPLVPGKYLLMAQLAILTPIISTTLVNQFIKNGSTTVSKSDVIIALSTTITDIPVFCDLVDLNGSTDYVQWFVTAGTHDLPLDPTQTKLFFTGVLLDQETSSVTPATQTRTSNFSTRGSDPDGHGTVDFPFASIPAAIAYGLTLSPTIGNPVVIKGDAGSYTSTNLTLPPNIILDGEGVFITDTSGSIKLDSSWEGAASTTAMLKIGSGITFNLGTVLDIDTTPFTTIGGNIEINATAYAPQFLIGNASHNLTLSGTPNFFAPTIATYTLFDGIDFDFTSGRFGDGDLVKLQSTNKNVTSSLTGCPNSDNWAVISSSGKTITFTTKGGARTGLSIDASAGGVITLNRDQTTWQALNSSTGTFADNLIGTGISTLVGTTYTLSELDQNVTTVTTNSAATSFLIDTQVNQPIPPGYTTYILQKGLGQVTVSAVSPGTTTIFSDTTTQLLGQGSLAKLTYLGVETWSLTGDLVGSWDNYDTSNNIGPFLFSMRTIAEATTTSGLNVKPIPGTSNFLAILQNGASTIYAFVFQFSNGVPIVPDASTWTTVTTSGSGALGIMVSLAVTTDGAHAIVSYVQTISAVSCQNLAPLFISGTSLTLGTIVQVRPTEGCPVAGSLVPLDTSNFGLVFQATTGNTLWAYQCSVTGSTPTITIGSSPLSIETGTGQNLNAKLSFVDSTHSMMLWMSLATGTVNYVFPSKITWNGTGGTPAISTGTALSTTGTAATSNGKALHITKNNATGAYICQYLQGNAIITQAVTNASPPVAVGSGYTTEVSVTANMTYSILPDNTHMIIGGTNTTFTNVFSFWLLDVDSSNNITLNKKFMLPFGVAATASVFSTVINPGQVMIGYPDAASSALTKMTILRT